MFPDVSEADRHLGTLDKSLYFGKDNQRDGKLITNGLFNVRSGTENKPAIAKAEVVDHIGWAQISQHQHVHVALPAGGHKRPASDGGIKAGEDEEKKNADEDTGVDPGNVENVDEPDESETDDEEEDDAFGHEERVTECKLKAKRSALKAKMGLATGKTLTLFKISVIN